MLSLPRKLIIDIVNLIGEDTSTLSAIFAPRALVLTCSAFDWLGDMELIIATISYRKEFWTEPLRATIEPVCQRGQFVKRWYDLDDFRQLSIMLIGFSTATFRVNPIRGYVSTQLTFETYDDRNQISAQIIDQSEWSCSCLPCNRGFTADCDDSACLKMAVAHNYFQAADPQVWQFMKKHRNNCFAHMIRYMVRHRSSARDELIDAFRLS